MKTAIAVIPEYTADDFLSTSAPFEFLYGFHENPFLEQQMMTKIKGRAAEVGVRNFVKLWKDYLSSIKIQNGKTIENATNFTDQPMELMCGEYICDDDGVRLKDFFGGESYVCRHPILPVRRLVNVDESDERLEIAYRKGKYWRSIVAEKAVIASSSQILQLAACGVMVNSENAKQLSTYLLEVENRNYEQIPEQKSVGRMGWVGTHGFSPYVEDLVFDGESHFRNIFNAVQCHGKADKWLSAVKKVRAEKTVSRIAIATSFASAILEPCGLLPFFCHFWGGQGTGKTVCLMLASSVWASPKMGDYILTFNSTDVGQEMTASFLNSLPMCIDELQIQASAGVRDFDRMIYKLAEGVGKTRGSKNGGLRQTTTWKNCMITTGEFPIVNANSMGGAVVRAIEVECTKPVYSDLVGLCAKLNDNYGFAGKAFVEWLQIPENAERINALQKEYFRELLKSDSTDKQAASAAAILAADEIATEIIFKDGNNLTVADIENILTKKSDVDANIRALEFVYELVSRNPNHFRPNDFGNYVAEVWGKIDDCYIYIIKSVFDRELSNEGYNSTAFLSWAKRNEILLCENGKRTKKIRVAGNLTNCVCIQTEAENAVENSAEHLDSILPY